MTFRKEHFRLFDSVLLSNPFKKQYNSIEMRISKRKSRQKRNFLGGKPNKINFNEPSSQNPSSNEIPLVVISKQNQQQQKQDREERNESTEMDDPFDDEKFTFDHLKFNLLPLKLISWIKILPHEFDKKTGMAQIDEYERTNNKKHPRYRFWQYFARFRIILLILASSQVNFRKGNSIYQVLWNCFLVFVTSVSIGLYFGYFKVTGHKIPTVNISLNSLVKRLKGNEIPSQNQNTHFNQKCLSKSKKSIQILLERPIRVNLLVYLPFFIYSIILFILGVMILEPNSRILLCSYEFFPTKLGVLQFISLAILDMIYYYFLTSEIYVAVFFMLFFMIQIEQQTDDAIEKLQLSNDLEEAQKSLQVIKLLIILFNFIFSTIVYLTKLIALAAAVIGGFLVIKLIDSHPFLALPFALIFIEGNVLFTVLFDQVHQIPAKVEELKEEILAQAQIQNGNMRFRGGGRKEEIKRVCRSVQQLGIQAGGFCVMERETTLIFGHFVLQKIVDLLITFH